MSGAPGTPRAVVLVGGPAAPYSRAQRIARALAADGYATEIAAVAVPALPLEQDLGSVVLRRYPPSGPWARLGRSAAAGATAVGATTGTGGGATTTGGSPAPTGGSATAADGRAPRLGLRRLLAPALTLRRWLFWPHAARGWWTTLARDLPPADVYHACGVLAVPAALAARGRHPIGPAGLPARVIYDAIDDALGGNEARRMPGPVRAWHRRRERHWARRADARTTVNETLARRLAARWGTEPPLVVINAPEPPDPAIVRDPPDLLREAAGLDPATAVVLFQGRLGPDLGLEAAADAVLAVPGAALVVLGFGRGFETVRGRDRDPRYAGRHVTLAARPADELLAWTASADVALVPLPPVSENQRAATPNKFWEAIAVGIPVVVPASLPVMRELVERHDLGVVAASAGPEDLAAAIRRVLERDRADRRAWRQRIAAVAAERFGWSAQAAAYRALVRDVTGRSATDATSGTDATGGTGATDAATTTGTDGDRADKPA